MKCLKYTKYRRNIVHTIRKKVTCSENSTVYSLLCRNPLGLTQVMKTVMSQKNWPMGKKHTIPWRMVRRIISVARGHTRWTSCCPSSVTQWVCPISGDSRTSVSGMVEVRTTYHMIVVTWLWSHQVTWLWSHQVTWLWSHNCRMLYFHCKDVYSEASFIWTPLIQTHVWEQIIIILRKVTRLSGYSLIQTVYSLIRTVILGTEVYG